MVRINFFALFTVLLFVPQILWATVHRVSYNVATVIDLKDDDEIDLVDFPVGWGYSRIVLGINSVPALQLSGHLVANDCFHELHSYYEEFDFAYTGNEKIVYHGSEQKLPIQWWVDANPVVSSCKSYSEMQRKDSIATMLYNLADSIYSEKIKDYKDLGKLNSETVFEGTSAFFKITHLPDVFYNRIYVQVEPMDGRKLEGAVFSSGKRIDVSEYSSTFVLEQRTALPPTFELAFPEYRKVKLKWWAEVGIPEEIVIEKKESVLSPDSVEVEYFFGESLYTNESVKLVFDKRKFVDGKVPVIKKLSFNPQGPNKSKTLGVRGNVYDIEAKLNPGDSVVVAIPLGFDYQAGKDSVVLEHFIEEENRWVAEPVDSIVGNFAYVKTGHFCWWIPVLVVIGVGTVACLISDGCRETVADGFRAIGRGLKWVYEIVKGLACGDIDKLKKMFEVSSSKPNWDLDQGSVNKLSIMQNGYDVIRALDEKRKNEQLVRLSDPYPECENLEICKWKRTAKNLDILLADAVLSQFNPKYANTSIGLGVSKYRFWFDISNGKGTVWDVDNNISYNYDDYFMVSSELVEEAGWFVHGVESCIGAVNLTGMTIQGCIDYFDGMVSGSWPKTCNAIFGFAENAVEFFSDYFKCPYFLANYENLLDRHEDKLIAISETMVRISLLAWLKKSNSFRDYTLLRYKAAYNGILAWLELAGTLMDYNNISIKAYASLALYEYIHFGTDENLEMMNGALNRHYGDNGGYSEGTGYSQYIWDDVPYVLAALKDAYKQKNETFEINEKFLKSPDYMFEFSRPVGGVADNGKYKHYGLIPVEVDDGVTYNPDYRVWAKLKDDPKYLAMSQKYPLKAEDGKINPMVAFGYPDISLYIYYEKWLPNHGVLWGDFKDGIGLITAVNGDDTVALSMIAENGKMWTRGQAHDQQDNLSITLTSSKKGFLIQDPGYSGFGARSKTDRFHKYIDHNVLTTAYTSTRPWGQNDNRTIPFGDLWSRVYDLTGDFPGFGISTILGGFELFSSFDKNYSVEGGESASLEKIINEPQSGVIGFTATTKINKPSTMSMYDNDRSIMYFGGNFWVIDRPTNTEDMSWTWWANSPKENWDYIGVDLYGSWNGKLIPDRSPENDDDARILQNASRSDFIIGNDGKNYLKNYKYISTDAHAKSYVMTYFLGDETFTLDGTYCPIRAYQCFVNTSKNMCVIVPPAGESFKLCDVLPKNECFGEARSTGITMFAKTPLGEWTTRWVLDGDLWAGKEVLDFKIASATVSRKSYVYEKLDGTLVTVPYKGTYLPALPILLLR